MSIPHLGNINPDTKSPPFLLNDWEFVSLEDVAILGQSLVPSVLLELTVVVRRGRPAQRRYLKGPLISFWLLGFSPSPTQEPLATLWPTLESLLPLSPSPVLCPANPGHRNMHPRVMMKLARLLIKDRGQWTPDSIRKCGGTVKQGHLFRTKEQPAGPLRRWAEGRHAIASGAAE